MSDIFAPGIEPRISIAESYESHALYEDEIDREDDEERDEGLLWHISVIFHSFDRMSKSLFLTLVEPPHLR